jgi:hypothetical protein
MQRQWDERPAKEVAAMPETKAQRSAAARKGAATRKRHAAEVKNREQASAANHREQASATVDRTAELSDQVLKSLESGQRAAIDAVHKFIDIVDNALPALEHPSRRQEVIDAAMDMADRLVHTQYDFIRDVVQNAGKALGGRDNGK